MSTHAPKSGPGAAPLRHMPQVRYEKRVPVEVVALKSDRVPPSPISVEHSGVVRTKNESVLVRICQVEARGVGL